jgi:hypothetical protein
LIHEKYEGTSGPSKLGKEVCVLRTITDYSLGRVLALRHLNPEFEFDSEYGFMFVLSGISSSVMIYHTVYHVYLLPLVASKVMPKVNIFPIKI